MGGGGPWEACPIGSRARKDGSTLVLTANPLPADNHLGKKCSGQSDLLGTERGLLDRSFLRPSLQMASLLNYDDSFPGAPVKGRDSVGISRKHSESSRHTQ